MTVAPPAASPLLTMALSDSERGPILKVVDARTWPFSDAQRAAVVAGMEQTNRSVPKVTGLVHTYIVMKDEDPLGLVAVFPRGGAAELGVRFWSGGSTLVARILLATLYLVFQQFGSALATVYGNNTRVKRLLQRSGFRLLTLDMEPGTRRTLEVYGVTREDFYHLMERMEQYREQRQGSDG